MPNIYQIKWIVNVKKLQLVLVYSRKRYQWLSKEKVFPLPNSNSNYRVSSIEDRVWNQPNNKE